MLQQCKCVCVCLQVAGVVGTVTAGAVGLGAALQTAVWAGELTLHPPTYPWTHNGPLKSLDHAGSVKHYTHNFLCKSC